MEMEESLWRLKMDPISVFFLYKNVQFSICCNSYFGKSSIPILYPFLLAFHRYQDHQIRIL